MRLSTRPSSYVIPSYSLTGDLLAYPNCGMQYRYQNRGSLPPARPVQRWFGEFIHGVMEEAYRRWSSAGEGLSFPIPDDQLTEIEDLVKGRLRARGLVAQGPNLAELATRRARLALDEWGVYLFDLIAEAEVRLGGIRAMLTPDSARSDYYEVNGVVDVLSSFRFQARPSSRVLRLLYNDPVVGRRIDEIRREVGVQQADFEVIVDYKGMRRPSNEFDRRQDFINQILTYAWLRSRQRQTGTVVAGIVLFLNELLPSATDLQEPWEEVRDGTTDLLPEGADAEQLRAWKQQRRSFASPEDVLGLDYRVRRSAMLVPVTDVVVEQSLRGFDRLVGEIEAAVIRETRNGDVVQSWRDTARPQKRSCTVCDFKTFCPASLDPGSPKPPR